MRYRVEVIWTNNCRGLSNTYYCENYQHNTKANTLYLYDTEDELTHILSLDHAKTCEFIQDRKMGF